MYQLSRVRKSSKIGKLTGMNAVICFIRVDMPIPYTFVAALVLASVYVFGHRLHSTSRHREWVSVAAGISVATIFLDILPAITESQTHFLSNPKHIEALFPEQAVYLATMMGFVLFFWLEYMVTSPASEGAKPKTAYFVFRITAFAGYTGLIAYLLIHNIWKSILAMLLYSVAMAFHLLIVDHSLARERYGLYKRSGRWILAGATLAGWLIAVLTAIPDQWLARITGFVCGGVIMNSLVVEMPESSRGRLLPFVLAAAAYSLILIAALG
jgi:hypothetical protein